jgi:RND family efflux transporter MFP subunit
MSNPVKKIAMPIVAVIVLLLMIAWMAGLFSPKIAPGLTPAQQHSAQDAVATQLADVPVIEPVPASVEAKQATIISSRIMARINKINVRSGDSVSTGDLLIELEKSDLEAKAQQSAEQVRAVSARLREARQNLARVDELYKRKLVARAELDRARANYGSLKAELAGAQQGNEEAEAAMRFSEIRAPIDGRVVDRFAEPGDTASPGSKLMSLYNPLSLRIEAQVREHLALSLEEGQELQVEIPSLQKTVGAVIEERVPAADPGSRTFLIKARVQYNKDMLPGMYARLLVPAGTETQLLIPADRLVQAGQLNLVWVLEDGQAYRRFVRVGKPAADGQVEILAGLAAGDKILPPPAQ